MSAQELEWREYEVIYVLKPELDDKAAKDFMIKMKDFVEKDKELGRNVKVECQGRKKLAWVHSKKYQRGIYVQHRYLGRPSFVAQVERSLDLDESVLLRHSSVLKRAAEPSSYGVEEDFLEVPVVKDRRESSSYYGRGGDGDGYGYGYDSGDSGSRED